MQLKLTGRYIIKITAFMLLPFAMKSQTLPNDDIINYISRYAHIAINELVRSGVPASITIAQGILETQAGKSELVLKSNNHFGIKCKSNWAGPRVYHDDDAPGECFRKYKDAISSFKDHSFYLRSQPRYASLFKLDPNDYSGWAWGLKNAGYATNPNYAEILIKFIEEYQLNYLNEYANDEVQDTYDISDYLYEISGNGLIPSTEKVKNGSSNPGKKVTYPKGVFKINGTKVLYAASGSTISSIAKKHKIAVYKILFYNELPKSTVVLRKDDLIYLDAKKTVGNKTFHRVKRVESLRDISQHEGIQLSSLIKYNELKRNSKLKIGQKLRLKPRKSSPLKLKATPPGKKKIASRKKKHSSKKRSRKK